MRAFEPDFANFQRNYETGAAQCVFMRLPGDLETPVGAYLKLSPVFGPGFLLESVQGGAVRGRYSILGFAPDLILRAQNGACEIIRKGKTETSPLPLFETLRKMLQESRIEMPETLAPMATGVFGILGYGCVRQIEEIGAAKPYPFILPDSLLLRPTLTVVFDNARDEITLVASCWPDETDTRAKYDSARDMLTEAENALQQLPQFQSKTQQTGSAESPISNTSEQRYLKMVDTAKEYIRAGDAFQIVLSQRFEIPFPLPPFALYRALRRTNPSPYMFFFDLQDYALVGSSPEICVQLKQGKVTLRPIAGTIKRGATPAEDRANGEKLLADPKERAEHLMLLDLGRNDVGRVSQIGSVEVEEQFTLEHYSEVMHIVSQVSGRLQDGLDAIDILKAAFPAGTVSGAPKIRAMQIINELEVDARGFYGGCVGYFSASGDMDTAIILRTGLVKSGKLYVQAGAGIVADSQPANEQAECVAKARALFRAAEVAMESNG